MLGAGVTALLAAALLPLAGPAVQRRDTSTTQVAEQLFGTWVWPFEVLSLLLLVALVAAMAVSRMTRRRPRPTRRPPGPPRGRPA